MISELYRTHPLFIMHDQVIGWWFDKYVGIMLQCYYWPGFVIGMEDQLKDLFNPRTYSICKI